MTKFDLKIGNSSQRGRFENHDKDPVDKQGIPLELSGPKETPERIRGPKEGHSSFSNSALDKPRQEAYRKESFQGPEHKSSELQNHLSSRTIEELAGKLKDGFEKTQRVLVSSINERDDLSAEQLNKMISRIDGLMRDFKTVVDTDGLRLREEESRVLKIQVSL